MRIIYFAAALSLLTACSPPQAAAPPAPAAASGPAESEIKEGPLKAHVRLLSHDLFEGRAPSTRGGTLAAEYLATQLAVMGIDPGGDNGTYFQQVPIVESAVARTFSISVPGNTYKYFDDVVAFSGKEDAKVHVQGDVVFVGHGIVAPELKWNDYAGVDVKGKWVLVMVNDPPPSAEEPNLFSGKALTYYGRWTYKYEEAARQGAAGAILIHTDESATYPWQVVQSSWSGTQYSLPPEPGVPELGIKAWMRNDAAKDLVKRGGQDLDKLREQATKRGFKPVPLNVRAAATLEQRSARKTSPNVVGILKGSNDKQAVVLSAHYDHFGIRDPRPGDKPDTDRIFNGAYDNASGCAGLLMIAQSMARASQKPGRSMVFVFTTAEESGLLGSEFYAQHPNLPLDQIAANINMDEINYLGKAHDIVLLGADRSSLGATAEALAKERGRTVGSDQHPERGYFFRSDHFPFAKGGVPALSISEPREFLGPSAAELRKKQEAYNDTDYHQPSDQYNPAWDFSGGVEDMQFLAQLAWRIAAQPELPHYNEGDQFANARKEGTR
jgi:Zn-dependent M28 family amino/carboxypeptidase